MDINELDEIKSMADKIWLMADRMQSNPLTYANGHTKATPIDELGLSTYVHDRLTRADIKYVEQLKKLSKRDLLKIRGIGDKAVDEIMGKVKSSH